jgi:hypothetical protein
MVTGPLLLFVTWRWALSASEESELSGVIGWDFFRFLHFVIIFSSQPELDVITVIDMLVQYRQLVHII